MRLITTVFVFLIICGFNSSKNGWTDLAKEVPAVEKNAETSNDSVLIPAFEVLVELDFAAEKKLKSKKETILVTAFFRGIPKDTTVQDYLEWGHVLIGKHTIELTDKRTAKFENIKINKQLHDGLADENFEVLINVYSGRKRSKFNLLDCQTIQKPINEIRGRQTIIRGKLL